MTSVAILGFAQLMESDTPPPTPAQKASIDQILHAGWYLLELINEILDLAMVESGKLSLSLEPVSLAEVMLEKEAIGIILKEQLEGRTARPDAEKPRRTGKARRNPRVAKPKNRQ